MSRSSCLLGIHAVLFALLLLPGLQTSRVLAAPTQDAQQQAARAASVLGTVQSITGRVLTVKTDAGTTIEVTLPPDAHLLRIEPGQKSLQGASILALADLQTGDRVLIRGAPAADQGADGQQITASTLVAIKRADIAQRQQQERDDWRRRGAGGLVKSVDTAAGTITISTNAGKQTMIITTTPNTVLRRYAPASVKFDEAKAAPLAEIKPGDQLEARGAKSADGQSMQADEVVSGSFRNIAGTVVSIDPASSTLTINDLASKKQVLVQVTPDTQMKKLDPAVAQRIALRLKGGDQPATQNGQPSGPPGAQPGGQPGGGPGGSSRPAPDPSQFLARAPSVALKDYDKGSAVMLVATDGTAPGSVTAVTIIGGVEPMLQASASGSQAMLSNSWNLNGGGGGDEAPQ